MKSRFPSIKIRPDGSKGCRGCGEAIPKGRLTWCSRACVKKYDPFHVKHAVKLRAFECCEKCGKDCSWRGQDLWKQANPPWSEHRRDFPKGEYDHIIPHCEGGPFTVENIRFLCRACHYENTARQARERAAKRKMKLRA